MSDLQFDDHRLSSTNPAVQLDVGAFAKGYAVDEAIAILKQRGISNAIINAGGDLRAIGRHGDRPWHIGIRHPLEPGVIAAIDTQIDESVFTSGNYERFYDFEGHRYHHIIDPRSGYPSTGTLSVTVIGNNAATADAAATALMIAGPNEWDRVAGQMGIDKAMLIDDQLTVYMTSAMQQRVELNGQLKTVIIDGGP
jgi:thiamine biosynthesis lipoprotein